MGKSERFGDEFSKSLWEPVGKQLWVFPQVSIGSAVSIALFYSEFSLSGLGVVKGSIRVSRPALRFSFSL